MTEERIKIIEKYFFIVIVGLNLIPVLSGRFFPTLDGAAHLYNSNLINHLLFNANEELSKFFMFNHEPVPNWTGYIILSVFNSFLPAFVAEKILLLFYLIGLPLAFRSLIKTIAPDNYFFSYLIFPFLYSFPFFLGFYNFSIAIVFLFIALNYWIKNNGNELSVLATVKFALLILLVYFSHIFVFAFLLLLITIYIGTDFFIQVLRDFDQRKKIAQNALKKSGILLIASSIPLVLFLYYFYSRGYPRTYSFLTQTELVSWLKNIRPTIALSFLEEEKYTKKLFYLISVLTAIAMYNRVNLIKIYRSESFRKNLLTAIKSVVAISDFLFFFLVVVLVLYMKLPDSDGYAGYVSVRLGLLFFIFLVTWLAMQNFPRWVGVFITMVVLYINFSLNSYYTGATKELNKVAIECNDAAQYILPNSTVLPINYSDNWLFGHFSNYLGVDKPMVILENYECELDYFPLKWNQRSFPNLIVSDTSSKQLPCINYRTNIENPPSKINYVFILDNYRVPSDSCNGQFKRILAKNYTSVYRSGHCELYEAKK